MESCRSSDSELERELAEKEREIQQRDQELTHCYRTIAGKCLLFLIRKTITLKNLQKWPNIWEEEGMMK